MRKLRMCMLALVAALVSTAMVADDKDETVYLFGVGAAFGDSVIYFTDIQTLEGKGLLKKGLLENRNDYSYQLKTYLENQLNLPHRTCAIYFSEKKSKLEKQYLKLRKKYEVDSTMVFRPLDAGQFRFHTYSFE